jgi:hypothetical protein
VISQDAAEAIADLLCNAVRSLLQAQSVALAVAPPDIRTPLQPLWGAAASAKGMLLAIWQKYPNLDKRNGSEQLADWQVTKTLFEWAQEWKWGEVTRGQLLATLEDAKQALALAAAALSRDEPLRRKRFDAQLSAATSIVQACVDALQPPRNLLEKRSAASEIGPETPGTTAPEPAPDERQSAGKVPTQPTIESKGATSEGWSAQAVKLYQDLVQARLAEATCDACGKSLASAVVVRTNTSVGPELNEYGFSDIGAARYLAATDDLIVACGHCRGRVVVTAARSFAG